MVSDVRCIGVSDRRQYFDGRRESAHSDTITSHSLPTTDDLALPKTIVLGEALAIVATAPPYTSFVTQFRWSVLAGARRRPFVVGMMGVVGYRVRL